MSNWQKVFSEFYKNKTSDLAGFKKSAAENFSTYGIYPDSIHECEGSYLFILKQEKVKKLVVFGDDGKAYKAFNGQETDADGVKLKICPLSHENCLVIREKFPFTKPSAVLEYQKTFGLGDRLGLATPGHIRLMKKYDVKPIFAQQSIRELNLTGRTYDDVLDDASWGVFQENYTTGFGADGDHLKKPEEIEYALGCGYTMITLDCSEHIDNNISKMSDAEVDKLYAGLGADVTGKYEQKYLDKTFPLKDGFAIEITSADLKRIILVYKKAVDFATEMYNKYIKNYSRKVDFEMSIDETMTPTSAESHFFVAKELVDAGVKAATLAPRFCGEFQKGIDYIGDIAQFDEEFKFHYAIADYFGYKISVHSGSDKFSVFPTIGRETKGRYHVKTAGTNWLEAVRVITMKAPALYREMHAFALEVLDEARKYYHIGADVKKIPDINKLGDAELPGLMDKIDSRQVIHITYGIILQAKKSDGTSLFKERIYEVLHTYEQDYYDVLYKHIGRHLKDLGL